MSELKQFFLFCSGIDQKTLEQCPSDENKYMGIGATVFFTGVLAFFSSAYALYTVFDTWLAAILFGVIWGLMIFNLDRYIVSSMKSKRGFFGNLGMALPRLAMAILLALVISKPLELKIFEKEINAELLVMEQEKYKEQEDRIQERYTPQISGYETEINRLQAEIDTKTEARDAKALAALQEADGSGGSQIRNMGPIYRAKKAEADKAQVELDQMIALNQPQIVEKTTAVSELKAQVSAEITALERGAYGGLAARTEALSRLAAQSDAIAWASLFVMLLFVAVETAPILVKLISPRSPYDHLIAEHEQQFELAAKETMDVRRSVVLNRIREATEVGLHQTKGNIKVRRAEIDAEVQEQLERLRNGGYLLE